MPGIFQNKWSVVQLSWEVGTDKGKEKMAKKKKKLFQILSNALKCDGDMKTYWTVGMTHIALDFHSYIWP